MTLAKYQTKASRSLFQVRELVIVTGLLLFSCLFGQGFFLNALVSRRPNTIGVILITGLVAITFLTARTATLGEVAKSCYGKLLIVSLGLIGFSTWITPCLQFGISGMAVPIAMALHFGVLSMFLLGLYAKDDDSILIVHKFMVWISVVFLVVQVIGALFLPIWYYTAFASSRAGEVALTRADTVRLLMPSTVSIFIAYSFCYSIEKVIKNPLRNTYHIMFIGLYLIHLLFVNMGRRLLVVSIVMVVIAALIETDKKRSVWYSVIVVICIAVLMLFVPGLYERGGELIYSVYDEMQIGSTRASNVGIRLEGISFWAFLFADTGYVGLGKVVPDMVPANSVLAFMDVDEGYKFSDLYSLEILFRYGFPALLVSIILYFFLFRDIGRGLWAAKIPSHYHILRGLRLFVLFQLIGQGSLYWNVGSAFPWGVILYMVWFLSPARRIA